MKRIATTLLVASLMATPMLALPPPSAAAVNIGIAVAIVPPVLPVYAQPVVPGPGYLWTPGYWAWGGPDGYYWVPGAWVLPPALGLLWTPGWWGWSSGFYRWHGGYWGTHVGFYGGVNYGFGYSGTGYSGGHWRGRNFIYNRAANNYNNRTVNRVSYNGGRGGIMAQPSASQRTWANQRRFQPTSMQTQQRETAMRDPAQRFKTNQGRPAIFATQHAGRSEGSHAVRTPAAANSRMVSAPERARGMVEAPRNRTRPMAAADRSSSRGRMTRAPDTGYAQARPTQQRGEPVQRGQRQGQYNRAEMSRPRAAAPARAAQRAQAKPQHAKQNKNKNQHQHH